MSLTAGAPRGELGAVSLGRSAWWVVMLSLETGCERPSPPPVQTPPPASPPESPPPDVDPAALPVCGKDVIAEPLRR